MKRWEAKAKNGDKITEDDINWELVKEEVVSLSLNNNGQKIILPNNMRYIQGKSACAPLGKGKVEVLSRYIGFTYGTILVKVRVDEKNNDISIEVTDESNNLHNSK